MKMRVRRSHELALGSPAGQFLAPKEPYESLRV